MPESPQSTRNLLASAEAPILRDQWYVAAFSEELGPRPVGRRICGEPVVLFRRADGKAAALEDRCSHRKYPLSRGEIVGDTLQCGYHGARFSAEGTCLQIPGQDSAPRGFDLRSYPIHEMNGTILIWTGDPAMADLAHIPDWSINAAPDWAAVRGLHRMAANYQLVLDNLLDLTHVAFVHKMLKGPGITENPLEFDIEGDVVHTRRMMRDVDLPGLFKAVGRTGKVDRWQKQIVRAPSYVYFESGAAPSGSNAEMTEPHHVVIQGITPETDKSTHYFWSVARHFAQDDETVSKAFHDISSDAFDEDCAVLEAQQRSIDADRSGRPLRAFLCDAAGVAVRRIVARKLQEESAT